MGWTEKKYLFLEKMSIKENEKLLSRLVEKFAKFLKSKYPVVELARGGKTIQYFKINESKFIRPAYMFGGTDNAFHNLVIIYSNSLDNLAKNDEDEGGQFFPEDFDSMESMFAAMLDEIES